VAWTFFPVGALSWDKGNAKLVVFAGRERSFCGDCGTPLMFYDPEIPEWFEVNTCSLDEPLPHVPKDECWMEDRLPWVDCLGNLPPFFHGAPLPEES
jgi:hypothetical protein